MTPDEYRWWQMTSWSCPMCLTDHPDPFCSNCGRNLITTAAAAKPPWEGQAAAAEEAKNT